MSGANLSRVLRSVRSATRTLQFGFVQGHSYLDAASLAQIRATLESTGDEGNWGMVSEFESGFASLVGDGFASSFASGRMAFNAIMKAIGVGKNDEVILPGFTCSVMPNAILRLGAHPVYTDIDPDTLGSSAAAITRAITNKTKLIVAQHSFGIPCEIDNIIDVAREKGIRVVEDCAITLDSSLNGIAVGNWGDAAMFSTDHSKPINSMIGGILYTRDHMLHEKIQKYSRDSPQLSMARQRSLHKELLFERKWYAPNRYPRAMLIRKIHAWRSRLVASGGTAFLEDDYTIPRGEMQRYPYPAAIPPFLALVGSFELRRWRQESARRRQMLARLIATLRAEGVEGCIPKAYSDPHRAITPLRFAFVWPDADRIIAELDRYIDVNWIWFRQPIVCAIEGMESLLYRPGSCRVSERICKSIINLPCNVATGWEEELLLVTKNIFVKEAKRQ